MQIISGKRIKPVSLLIYGIHGIGKSTLPTEAEKPIYIGSEENDELDIDRLPKIINWKDLENQLNWLCEENRGYKTLVIDTIDGLEQIAQKEILSTQSGKTMATAFGGYGKAYEKMHDMFLFIRDNYLVELRDNYKMNIVVLAHAEKSKHEDPITATSFDCYSTAIHKKVKPIFEDWVSAILFATWQLYKTESNDGKERAIGDGTRIIYTEERPSHIAKNRFGLPFEIEFNKSGTWSEIMAHIKQFYKGAKEFEGRKVKPETSEKLQAIRELLNKVADESMQEKIQLSLERANGDEKELERINKKLQKLVG